MDVKYSRHNIICNITVIKNNQIFQVTLKNVQIEVRKAGLSTNLNMFEITHGRQSRSPCEDEGRTGVKALQVKECLRPPEARRKKDSSVEPWEGA